VAIHFMTEQHTFIRLDNVPVDEAIRKIKEYVEQAPTYGFVGCSGEHGEKTYQWKPEDDWEPLVRRILA